MTPVVALLPGWKAFDLKAKHGLPLDVTLETALSDGIGVEWPSFVDRARACGWLDYTIWREVSVALELAGVGADYRDGVLSRLALYMARAPGVVL